MSGSIQDAMWLIICGGFILLMQAGFCCLEGGLVRKKNTLNVAIKNFVDFCLSSIVFWMFGFAIMFGVTASGWYGTTGFFVFGVTDPHSQAFFIFELMFCGTAVTILSGAVAERIRFWGYVIATLVISAIIYPLFGHWAWGGMDEGHLTGWLGKFGFIDFAGSTVVHSVGGWVALAALIIIGPRSGRFEGTPIAFQANSLPLATLGVFLMWIGWFGFNGGNTLVLDDRIPFILINTILAGLGGSLIVIVISRMWLGRPHAQYILNGSLAGLVGITASCNIVSHPAALLIGAIAGVLCLACMRLLERLKIDDVVGAVPVHCAAGIWGTLAVALLGDPETWAGHTRLEQLGIQATGVGVAFIWAFGGSFVLLWLVNRWYPLRVSSKEERIGLDVAEHSLEQLQARILNDEALLAATVNQISEGILSIDPQGLIESINPAAERMFGYSQSEVIGQHISLLFDTGDADEKHFSARLLQGVGAETGHAHHLEINGKHQTGAIFPLDARINRMFVEGHTLYIGIFLDITEEKRARDAFQSERQNLYNMLDNLPICFHLQAPDYSVPFANKMFRERFGDPVNRTCHDLMHERSSPCEVCTTFRVFETGENVFSNWEAKDGSSYLTVCTPFKDIDGSDLVMEMAVDISDQKKVELELTIAKDEAERANEAKSQFLSMMSHELRTPLNAILGFSQLLELRQEKNTTDDIRVSVQQIFKAGEHLLSLVNDVLDLSSIEAGKLSLAIESFAVQKPVEELLDLIEPLAQKHQVRLLNRITPVKDFWIRADKTRFNQAILNLLSNGVKYNKPGGSVSLEIKEVSGDQIRISVFDTGRGIEKDHLELIFDPFHRLKLDNVTVEGAGIGLTITRQLVEMMNGRIAVESTPGLGSCFSIDLPKAAPAQPEDKPLRTLSL